jgi:hypothetical protein
MPAMDIPVPVDQRSKIYIRSRDTLPSAGTQEHQQVAATHQVEVKAT